MKPSLPQDAARTSRAAAAWVQRLHASAWSTPLARTAFALAALIVLATIGRSALATPAGSASADARASDASPAPLTPMLAPGPGASAADAGSPRPASPSSASPSSPEVAPAPASDAAAPVAPSSPRGRATEADPVVLNDASLDDLRRLPGVGAKRAQAILELRARIGRFRQIEDLMRVKGIGRATLKKLRPLVRLGDARATTPPP